MKIFKKVVAVAAIAVCASLTACQTSFKTDTDCDTGWNIIQYRLKDSVSGETTEESQFACFQVTLNSEKIDEIWLNVGEMTVDETQIEINRYNTSDYADYSATTYKKTLTLTKTNLKDAKKGWVKIADELAFSSSYFKISFYGGIKVNEMALVNGKGEKMSYTLKAAKIIYKDESGTIKSKPYFTESELKNMNLTEGSPISLFDEQDKFGEK